jgi:hypothetical protein
MSAKVQTAPKATVTSHETEINGVTVYSVPSRSSSDVYQVIERADGHPICCCTAAQYGRHCAHIAAVNEYNWRLQAKIAKAASKPAYETALPAYANAKSFSIFKAS